MDLIKLFKAIEELVFEVVSWLYFYPVTLWRILTRPQTMLAYAERELTDPEEDQFSDAVSPPIMLVLTLLIVQLLGRVIAPDVPDPAGQLADERNLLVFRALAFGLFPLLFAVLSLRGPKSRITRATLRPAFYSQSYVVIPLVFAISLAGQVRIAHPEGGGSWLALGIATAGAAWFLAVETVWLSHRTQRRRIVALALALLHLVMGIVLLGVVGFAANLISRP